jgi:hypothetical protein
VQRYIQDECTKKSERKMTYLFSGDGVDGGSAVALVCLQPSLLLSFASVPVCFSLPAAPVSVLFFVCVSEFFYCLSSPGSVIFFVSFPLFSGFFFWVLLASCFTDFFRLFPPIFWVLFLGSACVMLH